MRFSMLWNLPGVWGLNSRRQVKILSSGAPKFKLKLFKQADLGWADVGERWDMSVSQPRRERTETLLSNSWQKNILVKGKEKNWSPIRIRSSSLQRQDWRSSSHAASVLKFTGGFVPPSQGRIWNCKECFFSPIPSSIHHYLYLYVYCTVYGLIISLMFKNLDLSE